MITDRNISRQVSISDFAASLDEIIENIGMRFWKPVKLIY